jgi:hypothetical protein
MVHLEDHSKLRMMLLNIVEVMESYMKVILGNTFVEVLKVFGSISKKEPACICTYYALLCLTGTHKAFVRNFSVRLCKPAQCLIVDLKPTY